MKIVINWIKRFLIYFDIIPKEIYELAEQHRKRI